MVNAVKSAESGNPKPAVENNNKREIKRVKDRKLDWNAAVTPKKRPARGKFLCWFPHRSATFGDNTLFSWMLEQTCDIYILSGSGAIWDGLQIMLYIDC